MNRRVDVTFDVDKLGPDISPSRLSSKHMSVVFNHVRRFLGNPTGYKLRWPRPRTVGSGHGRSLRRRLCSGTFARVRAHGRSGQLPGGGAEGVEHGDGSPPSRSKGCCFRLFSCEGCAAPRAGACPVCAGAAHDAERGSRRWKPLAKRCRRREQRRCRCLRPARAGAPGSPSASPG